MANKFRFLLLTAALTLLVAEVPACASDSAAGAREVKPPELSEPSPEIQPISVIVEHSPSRATADEPSSGDSGASPELMVDAAPPAKAPESTKPAHK